MNPQTSQLKTNELPVGAGLVVCRMFRVRDSQWRAGESNLSPRKGLSSKGLLLPCHALLPRARLRCKALQSFNSSRIPWGSPNSSAMACAQFSLTVETCLSIITNTLSTILHSPILSHRPMLFKTGRTNRQRSNQLPLLLCFAERLSQKNGNDSLDREVQKWLLSRVHSLAG